MSDRPTPETDAYCLRAIGFPTGYEWREFARNLERHRDEARETLVRLRQDLADPPTDVQEAVLDKLNLRSVITERDEARALARELRDVFRVSLIRAYTSGYHHGHEATVEGGFIFVHQCDETEFHSENIHQMLCDKSLPEAAAALTKAKEVLP